MNMRIQRIEAFACRAPTDRPVATSFGIMQDRPAVFVRIDDGEGGFGWGEVFANWPAAGAEHRVNLLERDIAPLVLGRSVEDPRAFFAEISELTHIRALQCGEQGPFNQVIAGLDTALWDMKARRLGCPLRQLLNPEAPDAVAAYASGIHVSAATDLLARARKAGYRAFKVKIGFDAHADMSDLGQISDALGAEERLFADANQAFDVAQACRFLDRAQETRLDWLEEPLPVDAPRHEWAKVAAYSPVALAGGENVVGHDGFAQVTQDGTLHYIQPDVAKWGGVSGCWDVAQAALSVGRVYCPHFLGGGIGLAASAEILAAAGGPGLLEVDINENPLRSSFAGGGIDKHSGTWACAKGPGLGIDHLPQAVMSLVTHSIDMNAGATR